MGRPPVVTLTTDFGMADGYVAAMKGVILRIAPEAHLIDISHEIEPHRVRVAAFVLYAAYSYFPDHTIHIVVVDPGVGGDRRAIAFGTPAGSFVGPDNGVFTYIMAREEIQQLVELREPGYRLDPLSGTFHGRDLFAPAAAHLATGTPLGDLGPSVDDPVTLALPLLEVGPASLKGEVMHVDRFGNAITSIGRLAWRGAELVLDPAFGRGGPSGGAAFSAQGAVTDAAGWEITGICRTYAEADRDQVLALVGSGGYLEIAMREGSAARELRLSAGAPVVVRYS